jgi:hypothetical protein
MRTLRKGDIVTLKYRGKVYGGPVLRDQVGLRVDFRDQASGERWMALRDQLTKKRLPKA